MVYRLAFVIRIALEPRSQTSPLHKEGAHVNVYVI